MENFTTTELTEIEVKTLTGKIIGAAIEVHRALGAGLLEAAYEACLVYELRLKKLNDAPSRNPRPLGRGYGQIN